jgi:hypothetical protein
VKADNPFDLLLPAAMAKVAEEAGVYKGNPEWHCGSTGGRRDIKHKSDGDEDTGGNRQIKPVLTSSPLPY